MNLNLTQLVGRLTRDPELKTLNSGSNVVNFSVATSYTYKDKNKEKKEVTTFHNCVAYGPMADNIARFFHKGDEIYVQGRGENRSWDKPDGSKGYAHETIVDRFEFGQKYRPAGGTQEHAAQPAPHTPLSPSDVYGEPGLGQDGGQDIRIEDIPF